MLTSLLRKYFERKIVGKKPQWTVKYINQAWTKSDFRKGVLLGEKNRYLADPFLAIHDGNVSCFVEDAGFNRKKGVISVYSLESTGFVRKGECINEAFHLSYPFVFNFHNTFYMVPESSMNRDVRLYECTEFPSKWKLKRILLSGISAADTTIFEAFGSWWLMTNIDPLGQDDHSSELHLFYTNDPVNGTWIPHICNPIVNDPLFARMGGLIVQDGRIFRIAQNPDFCFYGRSVTIMEIVKISTSSYLEKEVCKITSDYDSSLLGLHHLSAISEHTVFDTLKDTRLPSSSLFHRSKRRA